MLKHENMDSINWHLLAITENIQNLCYVRASQSYRRTQPAETASAPT